ncbi:MAG: DNA alkylation repair protein [Bacteroidales bacterium]
MSTIIETIRKELIAGADEKTRISGERFFKEEVKLYGLKSAMVTGIAKKYFKELPDKRKPEVFKLCEELWKSGYLEEAGIASDWSYAVRKEYRPDDIRLFERWVDSFVNNWAACDTVCNHSVGTLIEMFPSTISTLKKWAVSKNLWLRRASAVSLIVPARKGLFLPDIFEIADILLTDTEDMVRKGYGWMLKSAGNAYMKEVFEYVLRNKAVMPRTSLRYAIEKMPKELKSLAMAK